MIRISDGVRLSEVGRDLARAGVWLGTRGSGTGTWPDEERRRGVEDGVRRHGFFAVWPELLGIPVVVAEEYGAVLSAAEYARFLAYMDLGAYAQHVYVPVTFEDPVVLAERVARCLRETAVAVV